MLRLLTPLTALLLSLISVDGRTFGDVRNCESIERRKCHDICEVKLPSDKVSTKVEFCGVRLSKTMDRHKEHCYRKLNLNISDGEVCFNLASSSRDVRIRGKRDTNDIKLVADYSDCVQECLRFSGFTECFNGCAAVTIVCRQNDFELKQTQRHLEKYTDCIVNALISDPAD